MEYKSFPSSIKAANNGYIEGYLATFGVDDVGDKIMPGAFTKTLNDTKAGNRTIKYLFNHDLSQPLGVIEELAEDSVGLYFKARISKTKSAQEKYEMAKEGILDSNSIGYRVVKSDYDEAGRRLLKEIQLYEGSLVTIPANHAAKVISVKRAKRLVGYLRKQYDDVSQLLADELEAMLRAMEGYEERLAELEKIVENIQRQPQSAPADSPDADGDDEEALLEAIREILSNS
ncbi:MAG: HK97 family phage prohead protease [Candidatus Anstonellaceae archaeon]